MLIKTKKFTAIVLLSLFAIPAIASLQTATGWGAVTIGSVGVYMAVATGVTILTGGAAAIGLLGAAILINNETNQPSDQTQAPLVIQLDPNKPLTTPTGWSSPTQPPATSSLTTTYGWTGDTVSAANDVTPLAACQSRWATSVTADSSTLATFGYYTCRNSVATSVGTVKGFTKCPPGYTQSGSSCNLSSASSAKKPIMGQQNIVRTGNTFAIDPQINPADINPKVTVTSTQVKVTSTDGSNTTVTINSDGTSTAVTNTPVTGGNTRVDTTNFGAPTGSGAPVTGTSSATVQGQGSLQTTSPTTGTTIDVSALNKEATQQQILAGQCGGTNNPKCKVDDSGFTDSKTTADSKITSAKDAIDNVFTDAETKNTNQSGGVGEGLSNPILDAIPTDSTCINPALDATAHTPRVEIPLCEHVADMQPVLKWCVYIFTLFGIWGIFFEPKAV
jgi:hypothetical protein